MGSSQGMPPPRPIRAPVSSVSDIDAAVNARLALERLDEYEDRFQQLTIRVTAIEQSAATKAEARSHRTTLVVTVIGSLGTIATAIIIWALNFATETKREAVSRSNESVKQKIEAAQEPAEAAYRRGVREGAEAALEQWRKEQEVKNLVLVPKDLVKSSPRGKP